jgi:hypothetical protein
MKAFVGAIVEGLRAIGRLVQGIPIAIDRHEVRRVQAEGIAVRASKARPFEINGMYIHGILQSLNFSETRTCSKFCLFKILPVQILPVRICCSASALCLGSPVDPDGLMLQCEFWATSSTQHRTFSQGTLRGGAIEKNRGRTGC